MNYPTYRPSKASQIQHEIRIPVTGILWATNFLNKNTPITAQQQACLKMISDAAKRLISLEDKLSTILKSKKKSEIYEFI